MKTIPFTLALLTAACSLTANATNPTKPHDSSHTKNQPQTQFQFPLPPWAQDSGAAITPPPPTTEGYIPETPRGIHPARTKNLIIENNSQKVNHQQDRTAGYLVWFLKNPTENPIQIVDVKIECACTSYQLATTTILPKATVPFVAYYDRRRIPPKGQVAIYIKTQESENSRRTTYFLANNVNTVKPEDKAWNQIMTWKEGQTTPKTVKIPIPEGATFRDLSPQTNPATPQHFDYTIKQQGKNLVLDATPQNGRPVAATWKIKLEHPDETFTYTEVTGIIRKNP